MADSELSRLTAEISQLSSALTEEIGDVDFLIGKFERILRGVNTAGLSIEIPLWDTPPAKTARRVGAKQLVTRREIALVFGQTGGEWRLHVRRDIYGHVASSGVRLLPSAPNEQLMETKMSFVASESPRTKIQALRKFRPLLDELKRRVEAELEAIRNTKKLTE